MSGSIKLSKRMQAIADMVSEGTAIADIGTDHAYLPIYLVMEKNHPRALAMDVREGPLSIAREHISEYHLESKIQVRLSDGLQEYHHGEADMIILAGMGGPLMSSILEAGIGKLEGLQELILQPQSEIFKFRRFLLENRIVITDEDMVQEDGKFYPMMKARLEPDRDRKALKMWKETELAYGKFLIRKRHPVLQRFLEKEKKQNEKILRSILSQGSETAKQRSEEIQKRLELNEACRKTMMEMI